MDYPLVKQRQYLEDACRMLEGKIQEMQHQKAVLTNAFNSIDQNQENILEEKTILAQEACKIMRKIITNF